MKGEAEAFAMEAKGRAEAEQMSKKAEAFKQYKDGAMVDMLLENLPLVSMTLMDEWIEEITVGEVWWNTMWLLNHVALYCFALTKVSISRLAVGIAAWPHDRLASFRLLIHVKLIPCHFIHFLLYNYCIILLTLTFLVSSAWMVLRSNCISLKLKFT